jgi:hypothetical protein
LILEEEIEGELEIELEVGLEVATELETGLEFVSVVTLVSDEVLTADEGLVTEVEIDDSLDELIDVVCDVSAEEA